MKKKVIYFHIGTMKTGSSSIQEFLWANRELLKQKGVAVLGRTEDDPVENLRTIKLARVAGRVSPSVLEKEEEWTDEFIKRLEARTERVFILTEELYWFAVVDPARRPRFSSFVKKMQSIAEVNVIVYFRRQDDFLMSHYQERLKYGWGNGRTCRERMLEDNYRWLHYRKPLEELTALVGRDHVSVRPFERGQFLDHSLFADFLHCAELELTDEFQMSERPQNPGVPLFLSEILRCLSFYNYSQEEREQVFRISLENRDYRCNVATQYPTLSPADRHWLMEQFAEGNRWIACEMLGRSDGILFYKPLPSTDEPWEEYRLDPQEVKTFFRSSDFLTRRIRNKMCRRILSVFEGQMPISLRTRSLIRVLLKKPIERAGLNPLLKYVRRRILPQG